MKIVFSDKKSGKTAQNDVPKELESALLGKKIGDEVEGSVVKLDGFKLKITGMSDSNGAPSRVEIDGTRKVWPLLSSGTGIRGAKKGFRSRRMIRGNTISTDTVQINTVITAYGTLPLEEVFKPKAKENE